MLQLGNPLVQALDSFNLDWKIIRSKRLVLTEMANLVISRNLDSSNQTQ